MASKEHLDQYAIELVQRFEDFTRWAIENWPNKNFPLMQSDFAQSRKEISKILGPKLGDGDAELSAHSDGDNTRRQYLDLNPTPWP